MILQESFRQFLGSQHMIFAFTVQCFREVNGLTWRLATAEALAATVVGRRFNGWSGRQLHSAVHIIWILLLLVGDFCPGPSHRSGASRVKVSSSFDFWSGAPAWMNRCGIG
ncbi:hypothetical protein TcCL_NonESM08017 [Trypanosoma cruzi]|nr:hypothetical protein TcCL_NonESM08017 [Trypanosoma cruzi]